MATDSITINVSDNTEQISLSVANEPTVSVSSDEGSPYYVGAEIDVERITGGVKITATDRQGTTTATVYDGAKGDKGDTGQDGVSPAVSVDEIEGGHTVTITDADHPEGQTFDVMDGEDGVQFYYGTTEEWDSQTTLVSEDGAVYVYTDAYTVGGENVPDIKIGDGLAYVVDLPFTSAPMDAHMSDSDIHITAEERTFWNNKNRAIVSGETLILTTL